MKARTLMFTLSIFFSLLYLSSVIFSDRPPDLELRYEDVEYSEAEGLEAMERKLGETDRQYAERLTKEIELAIAYDWTNKTPGHRVYSLRVPWWKNWILYLLGSDAYEYVDPAAAIVRGLGWCSQHALTYWGYMDRAGIDADIVHLNGHVVARVRVDDQWFLADPSFGIFIPDDLWEIEKRPSILSAYYPPDLLLFVTDVYGSSADNRIMPEISDYVGIGHMELERGANILVWLLPLILWAGWFALYAYDLQARKEKSYADQEKRSTG